MEAKTRGNYKYILFGFLVVTTTWGLFSCNQSSSDKIILQDSYPSITIEKSMGDLEVPGYMALIGNIGYLVKDGADTSEIMIISRRIEKGTKINYKPIGVMHLTSSEGSKKIIVATTPNKVYTSIQVNDLTEFSVQFGNIKRMIEQWYSGKDGYGSNRVVKWEEGNNVPE